MPVLRYLILPIFSNLFLFYFTESSVKSIIDFKDLTRFFTLSKKYKALLRTFFLK